MRKSLSTRRGQSLHHFAKICLLPVLLFFWGNVWGQTITLTQVSSGITATAYDSGAERTWNQNSVSFGAKALFKESGQARLQLQASNGIVYNTTALPGRITSITINQSGTARNYNLSGGTSRLVNSTAGDYSFSGTAVGGAATAWSSSSFTSTNYTFFAIKLAVSNASFITSVVITYEEACSAPTTPTQTNITSSSATLGWTAPSTAPANGYQYYLSTTNTAPDASTTPTANVGSGTSANVSVSANTTYYWWVRSNCSTSDKSGWVSGGNFTTPQLAASFPYNENFEGSNGTNWTYVNGTAVNKWYTASATQNGGTQSLYISNNNGTSNIYTNTSPGSVYAYRDIFIPSGSTNASLSFDYKVAGEPNYDMFRVWLVPVSYTPTVSTANTPSVITPLAGRIQVGGNFVNQTNYATYTINSIDISSFANQTMRFLFEWQNDNSGGTTNPAAAIDNLALTLPQPSTTVSHTSVAGFVATTASDSPQQSFTVSGVSLGANNITITPSAGYQISLISGSGYASTPIVLTPVSGTVPSTPIYVVLKKNSITGTANGTVTVSSSAVTPDKTVSLIGTINKAIFTSIATGNWESASTWDLAAVPGSADNVVIASAHTVTATASQTRDSGTTTTVAGTLATNAVYNNNGATTINGTFQINENGFGGGANDFVYGSTSNLIFNHNNNSEYGSIDAGHKYWPSAGPSNVTVNTNSPINLGVVRTVNGILQVASGFRNIGNVIIGTNGTLRLNAGYNWLNANSSPVYGTSSSLIYNSGGSPARSNEWTAGAGTIGTTAGLPHNVQVSNNTTVNFPNGSTSTFRVNGILTIDNGSALYQNYDGGSAGLIVGGNLILNGNLGLGSNEGGEITLAGNWTQGAASNFYPNGRKAVFNGTVAQTIQKVGGGTIDFDRIEINKTNATNVSLSNSTGNLTDININGTSSNVLSITGSGAGSLNLQNRILSFNNNGGFIYVDAAKVISAATGAIINVNGNKAVANNSGTGTLSFPVQVILNLNQNGVFDFGKSTNYISTVNGIVNINHSSAYVNTNPPIYATGSKLVYRSGGTYARKIEWSTTTGAGYPYDIQVTNNTILDYPNSGSAAFSTALGIANDLTIDNGSALYMSYGDNANKSGRLTIGRNLANSGAFSLGNAEGGDLNLGGNWTSSGTFIPNDGAVTFNGTNGDQAISSASIFDYLTINKTGAGSVNLAANIIVNKNLTLTNKSIVLGVYNLTLPNKSSLILSNVNSYINATGVGKLIRQNLDGTSDWIFPMGVAAAGRYAPITIKNLSGTTDLSVNVNTSITPSVSDPTRVLTTKWFVTTTNNVTSNIQTEWQAVAAETNSMTIPSTGSLAVTVGGAPYTFYNVNLVASTTTASNVSLSNTAANGIVIGNDNAVRLANDDCTGATNIIVDAPAINSSNAGATNSIAAIECGAVSLSALDVWYKFTTTSAGTYKIDATAGTISDLVLDLRSGACNGINLACSDSKFASGETESISILLDENTTYYYRIYKFGTGTGAFTTSVSSVPTIIATPAILAYGSVTYDTNSDKTFTLKASSLNPAAGNLSIAALSGYTYSLDGLTYSSTLNVPYTGGNLPGTAVHVRLHPTLNCTDYNGSINVSGGGAAAVNISVSGKGVVLANTTTDITATTFTANWNAVAGATGYKLDVYKKVVGPNATDLFISEYVEGTSNNRYLEIYNGTGNMVDLSDYQLRLYPNGNTTPTTFTLSGNLENNSTIVYRNNQSTIYTGTSVIASTVINYNGNDALALYKISSASNVDIFGRIGNDPGTAWTGTGGYSTLDKTLRRKSSLLNGVTINPTGTGSSAFTTLTTEWDLYNIDTVSGLGTHTFDGGTQYTYILQNGTVGNINSHTVTGLDPNTQYYYVVRAMSATCESANSNEVEITTNNTVVWNGTAWSNDNEGPTAILNSKITGAYDIPTSFETKDLEITSTGSLDIKADKDVIVNGNITLPADNKIVVESDASLVQKNTGADVNSNHSITVKRKALQPTKGYTFWSSPVSGQNLYNFSNGYNQALSGTPPGGTPWNRFFVYRESSDTFVTNITGEITLGTSSVFDQGRGYAIRGKNSYTPSGGTGEEIPAAADEFSFNGRMNNGSVFSQLLRNSCTAPEATCTKGYNMVGNPYPSNLDFDALYYANTAKIYGTAYFWTNNDITATAQQDGANYTGNNYAIYNLTGGTPAVEVDADPDQPVGANPIPNGVVKVGQGFIIKAKKLGAGTRVDFTNEMRVGYDADATFYNAKKAVKNRFWLKMTSPNKIANTVLVGYIPGATNGFEIDFDGELFIVGSDSFYSILGNKKLAIQGKANFGNEDIITVGTKYAVSGNYIISLGRKEGIFDTDQKIYLRDKLKNTYTDLASQDYTFFANKGLDESRFEIVYKNNEVLGAGTAKKSDFTVYRDGESFVIQSSEKLGKVQLFDVSGKLIFTTSTLQKELRLDATTISSGVYIIKAENSGNAKTKKIIR